jgi:hypothetical protein
MKTFAYIAFFLAASLFLSASESLPALKTLKCRGYITHLDLHRTAAQSLSNDLRNGAWTTAEHTFFQFEENGIVTILKSDNNGNLSNDTGTWAVVESEGVPFIVLREKGNASEQIFSAVQHCEGITLTDVSNHKEQRLFFHPFVADNRLQQIKTNLHGEWSSVGLNNSVAEFFRYRFHKDGSYIYMYGNDNRERREAGTWRLTKDGKHIVLQKDGFAASGNDKKVRLIQLTDISDHFMQIETLEPDRRSRVLSFVK